jgi:hypothetical protein
MGTLRSNGEDEARAYAEMDAPPARLDPTLEMERVAISDPRATPTVQIEGKREHAGPRNPEQATLPTPEDLVVELPERRPLTEAQPVVVPPALAAKWREEARRKAGA